MLASLHLFDLNEAYFTLSLLFAFGLVRPIVSQGMGPNPGIITSGFSVSKLIRIIRGGRTVLRDIYGDKVEEFKIAASLVAINGKDIIKPIFNNRIYSVKLDEDTAVKISTGKVEKRPNRLLKIVVDSLNIKRGSDGEN